MSIIDSLVTQALNEDFATRDATAQIISEQQISNATIISRQPAVICGIQLVNLVFEKLSTEITINWQVADGDLVQADQVLAKITGPSRPLISGERTALNFLQMLSATATLTKQYVDTISHTKTKLLDTRKTIPGYRQLQKYAVNCGGGCNHRFNLADGLLIKENHLASAGEDITLAIQQAKQLFPQLPLEIEVENLPQLTQALANAEQLDRIMLDNFSVEMTRQAVLLNQTTNNLPLVPLEVSGNINLDNIAAYAETGIEFISIGKITKDIQAIDLSMQFN